MLKEQTNQEKEKDKMAKEIKDIRKKVSTLNAIEYRRHRIMTELYARGGEIIDNEDEALEKLNKEIDAKSVDFAEILATKSFEFEIDRLKERKEILNQEIKTLEKLKVFIKNRLHRFIEAHGFIEVEIDGITKYAKAGYTKRKNINKDIIPDDKGRYVVTLTANDFLELKKAIKNEDIIIDIENYERHIVLKDLPDNDPSISTELNPQIKFVKQP